MILIDLCLNGGMITTKKSVMLPIFDQLLAGRRCEVLYRILWFTACFENYELLMDKLTYAYINLIHFIHVSEERVFKSCKKSY